jgi:hypothetical protein
MNSKSLRIVTATALSLVLAVPATVLAGGSKDAKASHFEKADKNNDGALTKDEVPPQRWQHLQNADANKDGKVTKDELRANFNNRGQARFQNADKNNDGALTKDEVTPERWQRLLNADANKDSKVTKDELAAFFKAKHGKRAQGKAGHAKPNNQAGHQERAVRS